MAKLTRNEPPRRSRELNLREDWKHLLAAAGMVGAVMGTLILGAVLRNPNQGRPEQGRIVTEAGPLSVRGGTIPVPATGTADPDGDDIEDRAREDARRLAASGDEWTLQVMVTCVPETPERLLRKLRGDPRLYLLPVLYNDEACLRICWGSFSTREAAAARRGLPAALEAINHEPIPRPVRDVIP